MRNTKQDFLVQCPYYREDDAQAVYCEGVQDGSRLRLGFLGRQQKRSYCEGFCRDRWKDCMIAKMLNRKYDYEP